MIVHIIFNVLFRWTSGMLLKIYNLLDDFTVNVPRRRDQTQTTLFRS